MARKRPRNLLLTGMSDPSGWRPEWWEQIFSAIRANPQHQYLFLTKRPDLLQLETGSENVWFGVTVTRRSELWRIEALKANIRAAHYHVTFEPLFDDPGEADLSGLDRIVIGTMTGTQRRKFPTAPEWAASLTGQAHALGIPVFMKEDLAPILGEERMVQEFPCAFRRPSGEKTPDPGCHPSAPILP